MYYYLYNVLQTLSIIRFSITLSQVYRSSRYSIKCSLEVNWSSRDSVKRNSFLHSNWTEANRIESALKICTSHDGIKTSFEVRASHDGIEASLGLVC